MSALQNKTALVTGSSSGIGLGVARYLASAGCRIMMHGIESEAEVSDSIAALQSLGATQVAYRSIDISKPNLAFALIQETLEVLGSVDILVNNAGIQHVSPITEFDDAAWDRVIEISNR